MDTAQALIFAVSFGLGIGVIHAVSAQFVPKGIKQHIIWALGLLTFAWFVGVGVGHLALWLTDTLL